LGWQVAVGVVDTAYDVLGPLLTTSNVQTDVARLQCGEDLAGCLAGEVGEDDFQSEGEAIQ